MEPQESQNKKDIHQLRSFLSSQTCLYSILFRFFGKNMNYKLKRFLQCHIYVMTKVQWSLCKVIQDRYYHKNINVTLKNRFFFPIKKNTCLRLFWKKRRSLETQQRKFLRSLNILFLFFFFWVFENFVSVSKRAYFFNVRPSWVIYVEPELYPCIFEAFLLSLEGKIEPAENFFIKTGLLKISICWTWSCVCFVQCFLIYNEPVSSSGLQAQIWARNE